MPEERIRFGTVPNLFIYENAVLKRHHFKPFSDSVFLDYRYIRDHAREIMKDFRVSAPTINMPIKNLSGGNIQKLILGREISGDPELLVASHPTYGLDVGATEYIREQLLEKREQGVAVLLVSEDLEEIFELSDRIAVIFDGTIMGIVNREDAKIEDVGLMMAGAHPGKGEKFLMLPRLLIEDREDVSRLFSFLVLVLSLLAGFAAVGLVFALAGANPFFAVEKIFVGSFGSVYGLKETLSKAIPLILIGAGLTIAFRGKFWNIGAESQLLFGAIFGTWVGLGFGSALPSLPGPRAHVRRGLPGRRALGRHPGPSQDQVRNQRGHLHAHVQLRGRGVHELPRRRALEGRHEARLPLHRRPREERDP